MNARTVRTSSRLAAVLPLLLATNFALAADEPADSMPAETLGTELDVVASESGAESYGSETLDAVAAKVQEHLPGIRINSIGESPVAGLYELITDGSIYYVDSSGNYLVDGDLVDLPHRVNLTESRLGRIQYGMINELPPEQFLAYEGKGDSPRSMTVFTDISCGYCRKLHREIDQLTDAGISVRYLMFPRAGVGSDAHQALESAWCADDPQQALTAAKAGEAIEPKTCDNPIEEHVALARELGLQGTPLIYLDNGMRIPGYRPAKEIVEIIENSEPMFPTQ